MFKSKEFFYHPSIKLFERRLINLPQTNQTARFVNNVLTIQLARVLLIQNDIIPLVPMNFNKGFRPIFDGFLPPQFIFMFIKLCFVLSKNG